MKKHSKNSSYRKSKALLEFSETYLTDYSDYLVDLRIRCKKRSGMSPSGDLKKMLYALGLSEENTCWEIKEKIWERLKIKKRPIKLREDRVPIINRNFYDSADIPILRNYEGKVLLDTLQLPLSATKVEVEKSLFYKICKSDATGYNSEDNIMLENTITNDIKSMELENLKYFSGSEGRIKEIYVNHYERNPKLRIAAIKIHGLKCMACGFDFNEFYSERGQNFIEVHHLRPVSKLGSEGDIVDPEKDMIVVCSNCHRMIHREKHNILSLEKLKRIIAV
jgi:hypothetical protein